MHNLAVTLSQCGYNRAVVYDLNVIVLIHYAGHFKERLDWFKKLDLLNISRRSVHVTVLASKGDGRHADEIMPNWSRVDVSFLEMASAWPIPKINGIIDGWPTPVWLPGGIYASTMIQSAM